MCIVYLQGVDVNVLYFTQSTLNQRNHEIKCLLLWPNGECYNQSPLNEHIATCFFLTIPENGVQKLKLATGCLRDRGKLHSIDTTFYVFVFK